MTFNRPRLLAIISLAFLCMLCIQCKQEKDYSEMSIMIGPNHKWAYVYILKNGTKKLTDFIYDDAREFQSSTNVARVQFEGKFALIDPNFKFISAFYDEMSIWVEEELIAVGKDGLYGFINPKGEEIIPLIYPKINFIVQDKQYVSVQNKSNQWGMLDEDNSTILDFRYTCKILYENHYAITCNETGKQGVITLKGDEVIAFAYDEVVFLKDNLFEVTKGDSTSLITSGGKSLFKCDSCHIYSPGYLTHLVLIDKDQKKGLVNYDGKLIVQPKFKEFMEEKFGMVIYQIEGRQHGLIDLKGNDLLGRTYEEVKIVSEDEVEVFEDKWEAIKIKKK
jgi:hypothetical protein